MSESLSAQRLYSCLQEKDKYKGTSAYLHQAGHFNEKVYDYFNEAFIRVLFMSHTNYMSKLLAFRLFKELIVTANFTLIDMLDERIEEEILKVAQYNKKIKELNRGANYFIQIEHIKKDQQVQKIGSSYVLLATQIVYVLAKWNPIDEENEETRFSQSYKELLKTGVPFPKDNQLNFFKKDEEEKYRKNYATWLKWYIQKVKEQDVEQTTKQLNQPSISALDKTEEKNTLNVQQSIQTVTKKVPEIVQEKIVSAVNIDKTGQAKKNEKSADQQKPGFEEQKQKMMRDFAEKLKKIQKQHQREQIKSFEALTKAQNQVKELQAQKDQLSKTLAQTKSQIEAFRQEKKTIQRQLRLKIEKIKILQTETKELKQQVNVTNPIVTLPSIQKQVADAQCYQIKVLPPTAYEDLQDKNDILLETLQNAEVHFNQKKQELQSELIFVKEQNKQLAASLASKNKEIAQYEAKKDLQQELIKNIIQEDSLIIEQQPIIQYRGAQPLVKNTLNETFKGHKSTVNIRNCSVSEYLRANTKHIEENVAPAFYGRPKSLKKTQSQRKMNTFHESKGFSNTAMTFECKGSSGKLNKTANNFNKASTRDHSTNLVTYYPFLRDYFQPVSEGSLNFKHFCLDLENKESSFFESQHIKAFLRTSDQTHFILTLSNKTNAELKIKILPGHYSFIVQGEKNRKIPSCSSTDVTIKSENIDLNLRYPVISIIIGKHQRISLSSSGQAQRTMHLPLPISLLNFCKVSADKEREWFNHCKMLKYSSDKISLNPFFSSIQQCLPSFKVSSNRGNTLTAKAYLQFLQLSDARVLLEIEQVRGQVSVGVSFRSDSINSSSFAKVVMQLMLFLLQK